MTTEHLYDGPSRFVPVLLDGGNDKNVPIFARSQQIYRLPAQYDLLAHRLRQPSRRPRRLPDSMSSHEPPSLSNKTLSVLDSLRRRHISMWESNADTFDERYIELELTAQGDDGPGNSRVYGSLRQLMEEVRQPVVPLVGAPGAGKTTLLRRLCYELSQADIGTNSDRIVVFLDLNEYPRKADTELLTWFAERFRQEHSGLPTLFQALSAGNVWLMLDGLNEMAYGTRPGQRFDDLRDTLEQFPYNNRVVVTCRRQDMVGSLGEARRFIVRPCLLNLSRTIS